MTDNFFMDNQQNINNKFGYCEMYEWAKIPKIPSLFGRIVQFDKTYTHTIKLAENTENIVGITTINSTIDSDSYPYWPNMFLYNEYGDIYITNANVALAKTEYDDVNEISYIKTYKQETYDPIVNENYDSNKQYIPRQNRKEWIRVCLLGKCIVEDDGNCKAGEYCTLYFGNDESKFGTVVPAKESDKFKLYVQYRVSEKTILVFNKPYYE